MLQPRHYNARGKAVSGPPALYDKWLIGAAFGLIMLGLTMVASSSVMISTKYFHHPFHFLAHQLMYLLAGLTAGIFVIRTDSQF